MSKLFKLKQWLTVPDAAKHLALNFGEEVSESDVLRLGLDGSLTLSVRFINHAVARPANIIPIANAKTVTGLEGEKVLLAIKLNENECISFDENEPYVTLTGLWDLPLIGAERLDVEHRYQIRTNGPAVELISLDGTFVKGRGDTLFQLQSRHGDDVKRTDYYPAGGVPDDAELVVRTDALRVFEQSIADNRRDIDRPLKTRERRTLLIVIAALCGEVKIKPGAYGAANRIAGATERLGTPVDADTIGRIFGEIEEALESRK